VALNPFLCVAALPETAIRAHIVHHNPLFTGNNKEKVLCRTSDDVRRVLKGCAAGLVFASTAYGLARTLGYGPISFTAIAYLFVVEGALLTGLNAFSKRFGGLADTIRNLVVVIEDEETKVKRLATGEVYRLTGNLEKLEK